MAVLSDKLWRTHFGSDRTILGKMVKLDGAPVTIIGVMPAGIRVSRRSRALDASGGQSPARGRLVLRSDWPPESRVFHRSGAGGDESVRPTAGSRRNRMQAITRALFLLQESLVGKIRPSLYVLLGAVGFILLIACANVANLLLDARRRAASGDRGPGIARRQPHPADPATADGKLPARDLRRRIGIAGRDLGYRISGETRAGRNDSETRRGQHEPRRSAVYVSAVARHQRGIWASPGDSIIESAVGRVP